MSRIIVGVDDSERSEDAVAFGGGLARENAVAVTVAHAYGWRHLGFVGTYEYNRFLLAESEKTLEKMSDPLRDLPALETRSLPEPSPARALQELAQEQEAGLIVVGSSHTGSVGRVLPGSVAERLLHGSACPVAVVPNGYRTAGWHDPKVIACGWDGSPGSEAALAAAQELARSSSAVLRVIQAFEPTLFASAPALGVGYVPFIEDARRKAEQALTERMARLTPEVTAEGRLHEGAAERELIEASEAVDLMVLGSRGYGPLRTVLLGGVSGKVVREAACPVIVVPNGSSQAVAPLIGASADEAATG